MGDPEQVDGLAAVAAARESVRALVENDDQRAEDLLKALPEPERFVASAAMAFVLARIERGAPGVLDQVWDFVESRLAASDVEWTLWRMFGGEEPGSD